MPDDTANHDDPLRAFLQRVWREDVTPLLRGNRADQRAKSARATGKAAAAAGLFFDTLLKLRGRPFTRALTVLGSSVGAMLPDAWDWKWLRDTADDRTRAAVAEQMRRRAAELPDREALQLFGLRADATLDDLKTVWRAISRRWHPDHAPDEQTRAEHHLRFVTYRAAYERLRDAYDAGRLPSN